MEELPTSSYIGKGDTEMNMFLCKVVSLFLFSAFLFSSLSADVGQYGCLPIASALYFLAFCYLVVNSNKK